MTELVLKNLAYSFYPKGICSFDEKEKYLSSHEYKKLSYWLNFNNKYIVQNLSLKIRNLILEKNIIHSMKDISLMHWEERCITLEVEILNDDILNKIKIYISLIVPFFFICVSDCRIKTNSIGLISHPKRNIFKEKNEYAYIIKEISNVIYENLDYNLFKDQYLNIIIPDISFMDIRFGDFTLFNAFFTDEKI